MKTLLLGLTSGIIIGIVGTVGFNSLDGEPDYVHVKGAGLSTIYLDDNSWETSNDSDGTTVLHVSTKSHRPRETDSFSIYSLRLSQCGKDSGFINFYRDRDAYYGQFRNIDFNRIPYTALTNLAQTMCAYAKSNKLKLTNK